MIKPSKHDLAMCVLAERDINTSLVAALEGLFEHCAMIHKHWGDGANAKQANEAITAAQEALSFTKRVRT